MKKILILLTAISLLSSACSTAAKSRTYIFQANDDNSVYEINRGKVRYDYLWGYFKGEQILLWAHAIPPVTSSDKPNDISRVCHVNILRSEPVRIERCTDIYIRNEGEYDNIKIDVLSAIVFNKGEDEGKQYFYRHNGNGFDLIDTKSISAEAWKQGSENIDTTNTPAQRVPAFSPENHLDDVATEILPTPPPNTDDNTANTDEPAQMPDADTINPDEPAQMPDADTINTDADTKIDVSVSEKSHELTQNSL